MNQTVTIFNSPPRSGKDYACAKLETGLFGVVGLSFKEGLIEDTANFLSWRGLGGREEFLAGYDGQYNKDNYHLVGHTIYHKVFEGDWIKDIPMYEVEGLYLSKRKVLQYVSEELRKPVEGEDYYGQVLAQKIRANPDKDIVISDGGFVEEILPIIDEVGAENINIVYIEREGCTFDGDTRRRLTQEDFPDTKLNFITIVNDGTENFELELLKLAEELGIGEE